MKSKVWSAVPALVLLVLVSYQANNAWGAERTWTDSTGAFDLVAELVVVEDDKALLRRQDGREVRVPLARLSAEDLRFLVITLSRLSKSVTEGE